MHPHHETTGTRWVKSSYSGASGNCVEVALDRSAIRDSKNPAAGHVTVPANHWCAFLSGVRRADDAS